MQNKIKSLYGYRICFEGIPGCGKSTLIESISKYLNKKGHENKTYYEPENKPFLNLYVDKMQKYSFAFQMYMLGRRFEIMRSSLSCDGISLIDRGIIGDMVFAITQIQKGWMTNEESLVYRKTCESCDADKNFITVYMKCDPEIALKRVQDRGNSDKSYDLEYMKSLSKKHEELFAKYISIDWSEHREEITDKDCERVLLNIIGQAF